MRLVPVPTREEPGEGGWIIAAVETDINPVFAEKRVNKNVTAKKTREVPCLETELFEASKIL
jgi:hypothetical protein